MRGPGGRERKRRAPRRRGPGRRSRSHHSGNDGSRRSSMIPEDGPTDYRPGGALRQPARTLQSAASSVRIVDRMTAAQKLIVALDVNNRESALKLVAVLRPRVTRFKVGMERFTACGPPLVRDIQGGGGQVFLDLKFHDIPNTVARASVEAARLGVAMFTLHLSGGVMMARRAVDEVEAHCQIHRLPRPQIVGVTVLTSLGDQDLGQVGVARSVEEQVLALAESARTAGLDGVVASPREVHAVRRTCGPALLIV